MDFDFALIAAPFRMQPGLRRLPDGARHLTALSAASALHAEKLQVVLAGGSRLAVPGFDAGPALVAIAQQAQREGIALPADVPFELAVEEDFAVLDGATGTLPWLSVCVPSHWAPEDKLGLDLLAVHAPVADSSTLQAASRHLVQLATSGEHWERHVWTISPSPRHDQHPGRHAREPWPGTADPELFAAGCYLRAERQTFFPVGRGTRQAVFTIRVMLQPLGAAVDSADKAARLHASLASMSDAVLQYKGLAAARAPLLRWLERRAAPAQ
ncbi:MAG: heme-dependent oxidative N-demethylase subunit alpha family protein [Ramlibacter sp.]